MSPYNASKFVVNGITRSAAMEYGKHGIRINALCPGMTAPPFIETFFETSPEQAKLVEASIPLGVVAQPEDQGNATVWLCSEQTRMITGIILPVDGGVPSG